MHNNFSGYIKATEKFAVNTEDYLKGHTDNLLGNLDSIKWTI